MKNLYHCTIHKAASSLIWRMLEHPDIKACFHHANYNTMHYETHLKDQIFENYSQNTKVEYVPENFFVHNWYSDYSTFKETNKHPDYRGFYLYRDPRELVVSAYWSWRNSHSGGGRNRAGLKQASFDDGICWVIDNMYEFNMFQAILDWVENCHDDKMKLYKYEDFFQSNESQLKHFKEIFSWFNIQPPKDNILNLFTFDRLAEGRKRGQENRRHHFRSGVASSFREQLSAKCLEHFYNKVGRAYVTKLGYDL